MKAYTSRLIGLFLTLVIVVAGFELLVDPYDALNGPRIAHFNANKTRRDEDGRRVTVGQLVLKRGQGTLLFGNSRAVDGFPRHMDDAAWPGGLTNAGMRGSSAFEMARAAVLAGRSPDLRCVVMTFDVATFSSSVKAKSTYWISALPDGNAFGAMARTSLSPHAFWRSVQTISDNVAGKPERDRWPDVYPPGEQRKRLVNGARGFIASYRSFEYDATRLDFLMATLGALSEHGVQVIGIIYPLHAWHEDAIIVAGQSEAERAWRRDMAERFAKLAVNHPAAPCASSKDGAVLWDFSGFQMARYSWPPSDHATEPQPYFYEAAHFTPRVGVAVLDRIIGRTPAAPFDSSGFGEVLTPQDDAAGDAQADTRRELWLRSDPDGQMIDQKLLEWMTSDAPESHGPRDPLSRDDWLALQRDIKHIPKR